MGGALRRALPLRGHAGARTVLWFRYNGGTAGALATGEMYRAYRRIAYVGGEKISHPAAQSLDYVRGHDALDCLECAAGRVVFPVFCGRESSGGSVVAGIPHCRLRVGSRASCDARAAGFLVLPPVARGGGPGVWLRRSGNVLLRPASAGRVHESVAFGSAGSSYVGAHHPLDVHRVRAQQRLALRGHGRHNGCRCAGSCWAPWAGGNSFGRRPRGAGHVGVVGMSRAGYRLNTGIGYDAPPVRRSSAVIAGPSPWFLR